MTDTCHPNSNQETIATTINDKKALKMFKPTALYVKTHNTTGLKYFGKTIRLNSIHSYKGSGVYWRRHLKVHGKNYTTELLGIWQNEEKLIEYAKKFSEENNIVKSELWANMVCEEGLQGASSGDSNVAKRQDVKQKMSQSSAKNGAGKFGENSLAFKGWYITPLGKFASLNEASKAHNTTKQNIHYSVFGRHYKHKGITKFTKPRDGYSFVNFK